MSRLRIFNHCSRRRVSFTCTQRPKIVLTWFTLYCILDCCPPRTIVGFVFETKSLFYTHTHYASSRLRAYRFVYNVYMHYQSATKYYGRAALLWRWEDFTGKRGWRRFFFFKLPAELVICIRLMWQRFNFSLFSLDSAILVTTFVFWLQVTRIN